MKRLISLVILAFPIVTNAAGESCNALLNLGLYNVSQSSSASDGQSLIKSTFCSADYSQIDSSSSVGVSIRGSYGPISGGSSVNVSSQDIITKQSQVCTSGFNSSAYSNSASDYSKTVYQGSLDAWNKCQDLANRGVVFDVQPSSTLQGVNVSITAPPGLSGIFYGVTQSGSGSSSCTVMANGKVLSVSQTKPFKFNAASKVIINCVRQMQANGDELSADQQDLYFVTSADTLPVPLAKIGSYSRVTADQVKAEVQSVFDEKLNNSMTGFEGKINAINNSVTDLEVKIDAKVCGGQTTPGNTNWQVYRSNVIYVDVDTSSCNFTKEPVLYVTSLIGNGHWGTTGVSSVYGTSARGFRVYIVNGTPQSANSLGWAVNWIGMMEE